MPADGDPWGDTGPTEEVKGAEVDFEEGDLIMVDFDGTLTRGENFSWHDEVEQPRPEMVDWVTQQYYAGAHVVIHTARTWDQASHIAALLTEWGCPYHGIRCEKGGSTGYVDDKSARLDEVLAYANGGTDAE